MYLCKAIKNYPLVAWVAQSLRSAIFHTFYRRPPGKNYAGCSLKIRN